MAVNSKNQRDNQQTNAGKSGSGESISFSAPAISLPKGGGAIRGIGEKFAANPVTGTGSMTVPIAVSPGRSGFGPQLALAYDSGSGNSPFGFGWNLSIPSITRKTDKGLPRYQDGNKGVADSDVFILSGAEDLMPVFKQDTVQNWVRDSQGGIEFDEFERDSHWVRRYRPRIEGLFARIERWQNLKTGVIHWRSISRDNVTTLYGLTQESRIADPADPDHSGRVFSWLICRSYDDKGNAIVYDYVAENDENIDHTQVNERNRVRSANRYLKRIVYGNRAPFSPQTTLDSPTTAQEAWLFEVVFDYGEHDESNPTPYKSTPWPMRNDSFSTYRAGFEMRTCRLCRRVLMFHRFDELEINPYLVRSTDFTYRYEQEPNDARNPIYSFLVSATQTGYRWNNGQYITRSLPPLEFEYSQVLTPEELAKQPVRDVDAESLENLPIGLDGTNYQWMDLDGEGTSGILSEQADGWYYKRNLSANHLAKDEESGCQHAVACFGATEVIADKPAGRPSAGAQFLDLAGDGQVDLVQMEDSLRGFYERTNNAGWKSFRPFASWPEVNTRDPNLRFVDLTGDGHVDILITEGEALTWYPSLAEDGFGPAIHLSLPLDEEKGPRLVFADGEQSIYLADLSGDGLSDLVRLRNGEVCYWPNLGYGRFGARVTMDNAPWFDSSDQFDQRRIRLADVDGSGTTDILYLHSDGVQIYFNQSGNRWSNAVALPQFPRIDAIASVQTLDLLGNGTACLVWSSPLPGAIRRPMRYLTLMEEKPHLLVGVKNNLGAETKVRYAPSTRFYLDDQRAGKPWITRLPFPVHAVERVETYDRISRNLFVTRYAYHHGYFDGAEREFRGFGMVEQLDTEEYAAFTKSGTMPEGKNLDAASHVPPVLTKTWFHTGAYIDSDHISDFYAGLSGDGNPGEYYREPELTDDQAGELLLPDTALPEGLTAEEEREACRALKGTMLRQEIYALDGTDKENHPYTVTEQNYAIERLQPRGSNRHAVFFTRAKEALTYEYERNPADPRIQHALTLEVDAFGNVLKSAAIGYGRRQPDAQLPESDQEKQIHPLITYTESCVTNAIDTLGVYRTPLPAETRTYELTGYASLRAGSRFQAADLVMPDLDNAKRLIHIFDSEIPYEQLPSSGKQRRLIEQVRTLYRKDDLTSFLPLAKVESLALPGENYKLALTPTLIHQVFKRKQDGQPDEQLLPLPAGLLGGKGADQGGYVLCDGNWWIPSGKIFYDSAANVSNPAITAAGEKAAASQGFYLIRKAADAFCQVTVVEYDRSNLLVTRTTDPVNNSISAENDYRALQPRLIIDPNRNRSAVAFDTLGLVVGTAVMGKPEEILGDSLAGFEADLSESTIIEHLANPLDDPHAILGCASSRLIYDFFAYRRTKAQPNPQPAAVYALVRETHDADLAHNHKTKIQHSFAYSDGFGREIQKKIQAEPGPVSLRDAEGEIIIGADGQPEMMTEEVAPRWVGSGWTVFNNKGNPVRQYEPFFSDTHCFEFDVKAGVSPVLFYDPVQRVAATLNANHTYQKVVFDPWQQATYDASDTVAAGGAQTGDPKTDPDIKGYVTEYFKSQPPDWHSWYNQRIGGALGAAERDAAQKAAAHVDTPNVAFLDTLGRTFLTFAHNKVACPGHTLDGTEDRYTTRIELDIEGNQRVVHDAKDRIVMIYDYDMLGNCIHQASMEAGERWILNDVAGKPISAWDSRHFLRRMTYDELRRPTGLYVTENGVERLAERTIYGEDQGDAKNLRGKAYRQYDGAGIVTNVAYDFKGNLLESRRDLLPEYKLAVDWLQNPAATDGSFTSSTTYDALNRPLCVSSPDGSIYSPIFNEANLLDQVHVRLRKSVEVTPFVTDIDYNAKGQREKIAYGNGVVTTYAYDPFTLRLTQLRTTRPPGADAVASQIFLDPTLVQDLRYTYDSSGNITRIEDAALRAIFHNNRQIDPVSFYTYDAIYRLIEAKGREHVGQAGFDFEPLNGDYRDYPFAGSQTNPNDLQALRNYTERYEYDSVGNFKMMRHLTNGSGWTRRYEYEEDSLIDYPIERGKKSNRLSRTTVGNGLNHIETYTHDSHGNMTSMPHLASMVWDFEDQLQQVDLRGGGKAYYVYNASGERVRKVIESQNGTRRNQRLYLGGFEVYREYQADGTAVNLERETLHIKDDKQRIALIETKTVTDSNPVNGPVPAMRYQLGNHLGSASLELDEYSSLVSYEEYHPYGTTSFQAGSSAAEVHLKRYRYTGKERDEETGLNYHGARYYITWFGRWTAADPAGIKDAANLYVYVKANPVAHIDHTGTQTSDPEIEQAVKGLLRNAPDPAFVLTEEGKLRVVNGRFGRAGEIEIYRRQLPRTIPEIGLKLRAEHVVPRFQLERQGVRYTGRPYRGAPTLMVSLQTGLTKDSMEASLRAEVASYERVNTPLPKSVQMQLTAEGAVFRTHMAAQLAAKNGVAEITYEQAEAAMEAQLEKLSPVERAKVLRARDLAPPKAHAGKMETGASVPDAPVNTNELNVPEPELMPPRPKSEPKGMSEKVNAAGQAVGGIVTVLFAIEQMKTAKSNDAIIFTGLCTIGVLLSAEFAAGATAVGVADSLLNGPPSTPEGEAGGELSYPYERPDPLGAGGSHP